MPVLQPEDLAFLLRNTDYKEEEIREWFREFIMVTRYLYLSLSLYLSFFVCMSLYLS